MKYLFNQRGGKSLVVTVITICVLFLISGGAMIYFTIKDRNIEFSEEVIAEATRVAEAELNKAYAVAEQYPFEKRFEAIQSIGYREPKEGNMPSSPLKKNIKKKMNFTLF